MQISFGRQRPTSIDMCLRLCSNEILFNLYEKSFYVFCIGWRRRLNLMKRLPTEMQTRVECMPGYREGTGVRH